MASRTRPSGCKVGTCRKDPLCQAQQLFSGKLGRSGMYTGAQAENTHHTRHTLAQKHTSHETHTGPGEIKICLLL